jgi:hypothetical protein
MKEEYINYLFNWAQSDGFKGNRDEFIKKIQTDDNAYNYVLRYAKNDGYKGSDDDFSIAVGRGAAAPVATAEPAKTETVTEPAKELRSEPMATVKAQALPETQVATLTVDMAKMPTMEVKSVEPTPTKEEPMTAEKKEAVKSDIESQLLPVTEKTEVKAIETPSDKMVIKSEAKVEPKPVEEVNRQKVTFSKPIIINGAKFDDDMNLMRTFNPSSFEEYKELSKLAKPVDKSLDEIAQSFGKYFESIELDRNISLSFPDPPNVKKKSVVTQNTENIFEDKIDNKNVYSYYDQKNDKWYIYNKERDENNWNEVTSPQIKKVLNTKYKNNSGEIDKSKIFKTEESEGKNIERIKEYYYYNKYLPTLIENWDSLKENQKENIKKDLNILLMKRLSRDMYWQEKNKERINDVKERIKRNETVDEIDMNLLKYGNPDERYDKFWEDVVEKTGAGDEEVKALIKKYKK